MDHDSERISARLAAIKREMENLGQEATQLEGEFNRLSRITPAQPKPASSQLDQTDDKHGSMAAKTDDDHGWSDKDLDAYGYGTSNFFR